MNIPRKLIAGIFVLFFLQVAGQDQQSKSLDSLAGRFVKSLRDGEREKIFVQTDKWYYIAGEELWFNAYCIGALSHKVYSHSKIVFADLLDDKDSVIAQLLLNNKMQKLEGRIALSPSLPEGYYWLRLYTRNMLRDTNSICVQPVYIFNSKRPSDGLNAKSKSKNLTGNGADLSKPQLIFFPEGGELISGTNATVAFLAADNKEKPMDISGYVTDNQDSVVSRFTSAAPGIGKFSFYVWKSRKYTVHIKGDNSNEFTYSLPLVNQFARQLSVVEQTDGYVRVQVALGDSIYKKNTSSYVLAVNRDSLCFAAVGTDMYDFTIPKSNLPDGKITLLLFNDKQQVVSERSFFVSANRPLVNVTTDKKIYGRREKVKLDITAANSGKKPLKALMTVSVVDNSLVKEFDGQNDLNAIKYDNIQFPLFYDQPDSIKSFSPQQWDLIMMTQKNSFTGKDFRTEVDLPAHDMVNPDSNFNNINGVILSKKNEPLKNKVVTLLGKGNNGTIMLDTTNEFGRFHFSLPEYTDSTQYVVQVTDAKGINRNEKIRIDTFSSPGFLTPEILKKRFLSPQKQILTKFKRTQLDTVAIGTGKEWLKSVTISAARKKEYSYIDSKRISQFSQIIKGDNIQSGSGTVGNALLMTRGITMKNGYVVIRGGGYHSGPNTEPLLIMDGSEIRLGDTSASIAGSSPLMNYLNSIPPDIIDFIEVLEGPEAAIYGVNGGNGVILINTNSQLRDNTFVGLMKYSPKHYFNAPDFEEPDYDKKEIKKSPEPDIRSTIYWDANFLADSTGNTTRYFFTADRPSAYSVRLTGITETGEIIYEQYKFNVGK